MMEDREVLYGFAFCGIPPRKLVRIWHQVPDTAVLMRLSRKDLVLLGATEHEATLWEDRRRSDSAWRREWESLPDRGVRFCWLSDPAYPERLKDLPDPPFGLLYKGKLPGADAPALAVVGARQATEYGRRIAREAGRILSRRGVQVISGMAFGIDGESHRGALEAMEIFPGSAGSFAVFGCGIEVCYPKEHEDLYAQLPVQGGLISELGLFEKPLPIHFPMRNRIIAGLSDGVMVVEARKKSGSFQTVEFALELGRDVLAVPGRLGDPLSTGCHLLIRDGAEIVTDLEEISERFYVQREMPLAKTEPEPAGTKRPKPKPADVIRPEPIRVTARKPADGSGRKQADVPEREPQNTRIREPVRGPGPGPDTMLRGKNRREALPAAAKNPEAGLAREEKLLYHMMDSGPMQEDDLRSGSAFGPAETAAILLQLEIKGLVRRTDGGYYAQAVTWHGKKSGDR